MATLIPTLTEITSAIEDVRDLGISHTAAIEKFVALVPELETAIADLRDVITHAEQLVTPTRTSSVAEPTTAATTSIVDRLKAQAEQPKPLPTITAAGEIHTGAEPSQDAQNGADSAWPTETPAEPAPAAQAAQTADELAPKPQAGVTFPEAS